MLSGTADARAEALKTETEAAGKVKGAMKKQFDALVATWTAETKPKTEVGDEAGE